MVVPFGTTAKRRNVEGDNFKEIECFSSATQGPDGGECPNWREPMAVTEIVSWGIDSVLRALVPPSGDWRPVDHGLLVVGATVTIAVEATAPAYQFNQR